jgi:Photosynthetic reaction centre cytochrome C subunit
MPKRKYITMTITVIIVTVGIGVAAGAPSAGALSACAPSGGQFKNLRVLPKNISSKDLSAIMVDEFNDGLGVSCNFCHAEEKNSHKLDYTSDAKPEKAMARSMMRMTLTINKHFFMARHAALGSPLLAVSCTTCHHGQPRPVNE